MSVSSVSKPLVIGSRRRSVAVGSPGMSSPVELAALVALLREGRRPWQVYAELVEETGSALHVLEHELERDDRSETLFDLDSLGQAADARIGVSAALDAAVANLSAPGGVQGRDASHPGLDAGACRGCYDEIKPPYEGECLP